MAGSEQDLCRMGGGAPHPTSLREATLPALAFGHDETSSGGRVGCASLLARRAVRCPFWRGARDAGRLTAPAAALAVVLVMPTPVCPHLGGIVLTTSRARWTFGFGLFPPGRPTSGPSLGLASFVQTLRGGWFSAGFHTPWPVFPHSRPPHFRSTSRRLELRPP